jgi:chromate transporter
MMAALQRELVDQKAWLTQEDYAVAFALARITPGTNVLAFCAAAGAKILRLPGAIAAVLAVTLPSALLTVLFTAGYEAWRTNPWVKAALAGTAAAVAGIMFSAVYLLVRKQARSLLRVVVFFVGAFLAMWYFKITPLPIIATAAAVGLLWKEDAKT